jgi:hypothetical protein
MNKSIVSLLFVTVAIIANAQMPTTNHPWPPTCWTNAVTVNPSEEDEYQALSSQARSLIITGKFNEADSLAADLRTSKSRFRNGEWKLRAFYGGFRTPADTSSEPQWKAMIVSIENWRTQKTNSISARVALAVALTGYAWHARGDGWAETVTDDGAKKMEERLNDAVAVLKEAKKLPKKCPHWYAALQTVAMGLGWERETCDAIMKEAVSFEPKYYAFYEFHAYYLLPRWYGNPGDWEAFAKQATVRDPTIYPRILRYFFLSGAGNVFSESQDASWILAKKGFNTWVDKCPDSLETKSFYCMFCGFVNDCEQMKLLFRQIGDNADLTVWRTADEFRQKRYWLHKWGDKMGPPRNK